ncbi:MAG: 23S rRNA (adenine(2503)-C(2))-methyltransferase RlmN [Gammaproteobacteria bacterium]|uniref:Dual-specificity RNA methyltransferase RlmN n=1 Tax=SAR86 cluster bacterium TaxID=2030880 RepID=A0A368BP95_9GAMM|nr:MAG: 23S rRNA (adenine(2503)-C(2))-methyltransferase RlmN [SAR86 cluster bacterium]
MQKEKINLLGFTHERLVEFFDSIDQPRFRASQLLKWIHQRGVIDFMLMTDFSLELRNNLSVIAEVKPPSVEECHVSPEGTKKYLIKLESGSMIEMVKIPEKKRMTLCISSQAGCALQCTFCATGAQGFEKNLSDAEIIGQLWLANFYDSSSPLISNVVFMGMGEPLLNVENVLSSISLMLHQNAYGLSKRRITLSTSGIVPEINKLAERTDVSLAISLHAANNILRDEIVPINKKYPLNDLLDACKQYLNNQSKRKTITIEYILIDGINDSIEHAKDLVKILKGLPCKINLIPFNPFEGCDYMRSKEDTIKDFKNFLVKKGFITTLRITRGDAIDGACGQLVGNLKKSVKGKNNKNSINLINTL